MANLHVLWYNICSLGVIKMLENKLNITNEIELAKEEEKITKLKALELFDTNKINEFEVGTTKGLCDIHRFLFNDIYLFAGEIREENLAKGNFRFASSMYLKDVLSKIDSMPEDTFEDIVKKYIEMNIAHPFREGNGRSTRIWLDMILKNRIGKVIDWSKIDKEEYLLAMERSPVKDTEVMILLKEALTDKIDDREVYMNGIDTSYKYEGYNTYTMEELDK
jgi:cell filamentation protein